MFTRQEKDRVISIKEDIDSQTAYIDARDGTQPRIVLLKGEDAEFMIEKLHAICCAEDQALTEVLVGLTGEKKREPKLKEKKAS